MLNGKVRQLQGCELFVYFCFLYKLLDVGYLESVQVILLDPKIHIDKEQAMIPHVIF